MMIAFNLKSHRLQINLSSRFCKGRLQDNIGLDTVSYVHPFSPGLKSAQASIHPSDKGNFSSQFMSPQKTTFGNFLRKLTASFAWAIRSSLCIWSHLGGAGQGLSRWLVATVNNFPLTSICQAQFSQHCRIAERFAAERFHWKFGQLQLTNQVRLQHYLKYEHWGNKLFDMQKNHISNNTSWDK